MHAPHRTTESHRQSHRDPAVGPKELRARSFKIRNAWSEAERQRRAYTARMVQWLLVGPPVGFRLQAE
jgi:hypothetical protein